MFMAEGFGSTRGSADRAERRRGIRSGFAHGEGALCLRGEGKDITGRRSSVEQQGAVLIIRGEHGTRGNVAVIAIPAGGQDPSGDTPVLTFVRQEKDYRLTGVWESKDRGEMVAAR